MIKITISNREYIWCGNLGNILESQEEGVKEGDVRIIKGKLFFAYSISSGPKWYYGTPRVRWTVPDVTLEKIKVIKKELLP